MSKIRIYTRFERFWHWSQAALVLSLALTGAEIHGLLTLLGFGPAVRLHSLLAWALLGLWAFAIFWHFTTGEWKNYIPTTHQLPAIARFYAWGIFHGEHHPYVKRQGMSKLNPLQRLAYLGLKLVINPALAITGLAYLFFNEWSARQGWSLETIAVAHTAAALAMTGFVIAHVYLTTTGHTVLAHIKAMVTGWEEESEHQSPGV